MRFSLSALPQGLWLVPYFAEAVVFHRGISPPSPFSQGEFRRHLRAKSRRYAAVALRTPPGGLLLVLQTNSPCRACGRRVSFPAIGKKPKDRRGTAQDERSALIFALPPVPLYGGRPPGSRCVISGAQNLSGWSEFPPGHWALGLKNLGLVRFHSRAWLYRANGCGANPGGPVWDRPLREDRIGSCICRRGGSISRP